jgi:hypothetical protein
MVHQGYNAEEAMFGSTTGALQLLQWNSIAYTTCTISKNAWNKSQTITKFFLEEKVQCI